MRLFRNITFSWVLFVAFFCGTAAGAVAANALSADLLGQLGYFGSIYRMSSLPDRIQKRRLWEMVCRQRLTGIGLAVLVGMTPLAAPGFVFICFAGGFGCGLMIAVMTLQRGILGMLTYLLTMFPHWLFYLPVWAFLAVKAEDGLSVLRLRIWGGLAVLMLLGTILEAYVNPYLM